MAYMVLKKLMHDFREGWANARQRYALWKARRELAARWLYRPRPKKHKLPGRLIVSLTSYPARFATLPQTLKCLLTQSVAPDRLILWIAYQDKVAITKDILGLQSEGVEILFCDDLKSYKKIIPTLQVEPDAFLVTADDDLYYWPTWLEELTANYSGNPKEVLCHRAHKIRLSQDGAPLPYSKWDFQTSSKKMSPLIFPTTGGGVMYPPAVFHTDVSNNAIFLENCPKADDIWLYWMVRLSGGQARKIGACHLLIDWPGTQETALWLENISDGGNDRQVTAMLRQYGLP